MTERFTLEFTLPEGKSLMDEESTPLVEWIGKVVGLSRIQGIKCDLYVNGKLETVDVQMEEKP